MTHQTRKAQLDDVKNIHRLVNRFADQGRMLALSLSEFTVVSGDDGRLLGCCVLHIVWEDLAEVRSLAVAEDAQHRGIGAQLVQACLQEARALGVPRVFALTYVPDYFARFGFAPVDKSTLPHKVWADCVKCPKFPDCDEVAVALDFASEA